MNTDAIEEQVRILEEQLISWARGSGHLSSEEVVRLKAVFVEPEDHILRDSFPGWKAEEPVKLTLQRIRHLEKGIKEAGAKQPGIARNALELLKHLEEAYSKPVKAPSGIRASSVQRFINNLPRKKWMRNRRLVLSHSKHTFQLWWLRPVSS